ncbi:MAG TPA: hypothetical protein VKV40_22575 [Ktedonobacteraceae bacterium]|nr:hypothetical protein [Ktedonobacteraceae bacterium]
MNTEELVQALRQLDTLYEQMHSVQALLFGDRGTRASYEQITTRIETAFPDLCVRRVSFTHRMAHGLFPLDEPDEKRKQQ